MFLYHGGRVAVRGRHGEVSCRARRCARAVSAGARRCARLQSGPDALASSPCMRATSSTDTQTHDACGDGCFPAGACALLSRSGLETMVRHACGDRKILKIFPRHTKKLCSGNFCAALLPVRCYAKQWTERAPGRHAPGARYQRCSWLTTLCGN
ncbi:hypothetical protein FU139_30160 [Burkholderia territorii]|nr:hypothetical protein FU139_30160 [Burkholderia territorii]